MTLSYRFKKEQLDNGKSVMRPRILIELAGKDATIMVPALIDSGCDITVIPEGIARGIGLDISGEKDKLFAYRENNDVVASNARFNFLGKELRQRVHLSGIPVLIALKQEGIEEEEDICLGVEGIFDAFDITFKKRENRIVFKFALDKNIRIKIAK